MAAALTRAPVRGKSRLAWLLLLWWSRAALWLRRWLWLLARRPLMRLGFAENEALDVGQSDEDDIDASANFKDASQSEREIALPSGLVNSGNLCFVNAVLQCLAALPRFLDAVDRALRLRTQLHVVTHADDAQVQKLLVAETLVSLLRGVSPMTESDETEEMEEMGVRRRGERDRHGGTRRDDNMQRMRRFRSAASHCTYLVSSAVARQEQQDAEEFLSFLLELLHELLRSPPPRDRGDEEERQQFLQAEQWFLKKLKSYDPNDPRSYMHAVAKLGEVRWNYFVRKNTSVITEMFAGQTVRGSQCCSCANLTCQHEEQRVISLAIDPSAAEQSLADCLERYRHPEQLQDENRVFCDSYCRAKTSRLTQILLQRVPPVLVIRLQRFQHTAVGSPAQKVDCAVQFPCGDKDLLDLTPNAFIRDGEKPNLFELVAVCAHLGSTIDSGHYVAYVRHRAERGDVSRWLRVDDDVVSVIDQETMHGETLQTAYLLFYTQVSR